MSDLNFEPVKARGKETIIIAGSFPTNGSGAISTATIEGKGFTVARTGVGTADITLEDKFLAVVSFVASIQRSAAADGDVKEIGSDAVSTTKKISITHLVAGAATEWPAANAANRVHFIAVLRNTSVP